MILRWDKICTLCWLGEKLEFHFLKHFSSLCCHMMSIVMMQNNSICQHSSVFTACRGLNSSSSIAQYYVLLTIWTWSWYCSRMVWIKSQNSSNTLPAEGTLLNFMVLGKDVCFHYVCLQVHISAPMFHHLWQSFAENFPFTISLQKLHVC